jgi:hypothetical protein
MNLSLKNTNMPYTIRTGEPSRPYNTLEWTNIGGSQHTQNTGAYTEQTTNMETTHRQGESKMQQETEPFETSGENPMEGGSINPTKVYKMLFLSAVEFESVTHRPGKHNYKNWTPSTTKDCVLAWELSLHSNRDEKSKQRTRQ